MNEIYCPECKCLTEHLEISDSLNICSVCGFEDNSKIKKNREEKKMGTKHIAEEVKNEIKKSMAERSKTKETIKGIAKRFNVSMPTVVRYARDTSKKISKPKSIIGEKELPINGVHPFRDRLKNLIREIVKEEMGDLDKRIEAALKKIF